jgi:predicted small secreted protein
MNIGIIKRTLLPVVGAVMLTGSFFAISGCNTVEGVGRDVENLGDAIEDKADKESRN